MDVGATVVGSVPDVDGALHALSAANGQIDAAILDVNLRGQSSITVADRLVELEIPFIIQTGYQCDTLPERFRHIPCVGKPAEEQYLISLLQRFR